MVRETQIDGIRVYVDHPETRSELQAEDVVQRLLARLASSQPSINAMVTISTDLALADARRVDRGRSSGKRLPLDGMPIVVKDNIDVAGVRTTNGSKIYETAIAREDAEVVRRLRAAGGVILGKSLPHEFCYGLSCDSETYGRCRNPWDLERIPGGSSGGSGAALAADLCVGAIGSDTGGSVRIPSALNGITGLRPTPGRVSTRGSFPLAPSLDTLGPMARSAADVERLFRVMAGYDPGDIRSVDPWILPSDDRRFSAPLRIGVESGYFFEGLQDGVRQCIEEMAATLSRAGASVMDVTLPGALGASQASGTIITAEAFAVHRMHDDEQRKSMEPETRERILAGASIGATELLDAIEIGFEWRRTLNSTFAKGLDFILTPTVAWVAPRLSDLSSGEHSRTCARFTNPFSLGGAPALSLPCGLSEGLPVGAQLVAQPWHEIPLLQMAASYQRVTDWHLIRPAATSTP